MFFSTKIDWFAVLQGAFLIAIAPGIAGLLHYFKAGLQGRHRRFANAWQPYRDIYKLFRMPAVISDRCSWLFAITPTVLFVAYGWLAFLLPIISRRPLIFTDLIVVVYVMGLARFTLSLAGLDSGAPFGGLGSSREMFFHFMSEIGLILILAALALHWNTVQIEELIRHHEQSAYTIFFKPDLLLLAISMAILILFETGRIPIDNPTTHLELTMAQKAITLEYAGRDLALIEWAEMIKLAFLLTLFSDLFLPFSLFSFLESSASWLFVVVSLVEYLSKMILLAVVLALWETHRPKLRLRKVVELALISMALSLMAIVYVVIATGS
jgi:formate hydrogenlyase subunit 4